jgi:hypothetical protein
LPICRHTAQAKRNYGHPRPLSRPCTSFAEVLQTLSYRPQTWWHRPAVKQASFLKSFFFHECCGSDVRLVKKFVGLSPSFPMQSSQGQIVGSHVHRMRHEMSFDNGKLCAIRLASVTFSQQKFLEGNPWRHSFSVAHMTSSLIYWRCRLFVINILLRGFGSSSLSISYSVDTTKPPVIQGFVPTRC